MDCEKEIIMENAPSVSLLMPFSVRFAINPVIVHGGDQTGGAETETDTSKDGIVTKDTVEDEDTD